AIKIKSCRASRNVNNSTFRVERHSRPVVCRSARLPRIRGPRLVTSFSWMRNRVERPAQLARSNIKCPNITGWRWQRFRIAATGDKQVFVYKHGACQNNRLRLYGFAPKLLAEVDASLASESRNRFPGCAIERVYEIHYPNKDSR